MGEHQSFLSSRIAGRICAIVETIHGGNTAATATGVPFHYGIHARCWGNDYGVGTGLSNKAVPNILNIIK